MTTPLPFRCVSCHLLVAVMVVLGSGPMAFAQPAAPAAAPAGPATPAKQPSPSEIVEKVKDTVEVRFDQGYASTDNPRQQIDIFLPRKRATDTPLPVVAFIHGGGWSGGDRKGFVGSAIEMAKSGRYVAVAVGYRLSGEAKWPAQIHDCRRQSAGSAAMRRNSASMPTALV